MASEPADVLVVGAGASGAVVALRLAEAGFRVICLEQGEWHDKREYPGVRPDWELAARKQWATSPNIRGLPEDYPVVEDDSAMSPLMFNGVGGSTILFAGAWPRMLPSDFRVRSLDRATGQIRVHPVVALGDDGAVISDLRPEIPHGAWARSGPTVPLRMEMRMYRWCLCFGEFVVNWQDLRSGPGQRPRSTT